MAKSITSLILFPKELSVRIVTLSSYSSIRDHLQNSTQNIGLPPKLLGFATPFVLYKAKVTVLHLLEHFLLSDCLLGFPLTILNFLWAPICYIVCNMHWSCHHYLLMYMFDYYSVLVTETCGSCIVKNAATDIAKHAIMKTCLSQSGSYCDC